jgi:hypothetical protein
LMRRLHPAARRGPSPTLRLLRQLPRSSVAPYLQSVLPSWFWGRLLLYDRRNPRLLFNR